MALEILIIRLSAIGDVIHTLPVVHAIKALPVESRITWLVEPAAAGLLTDNPAVDEVIVFPGKFKTGADFGHWWHSIVEWYQCFSQRRFDMAIDAQGLFKSALFAWLSRAKIKIGFAKTREFADRFLTYPVDVGDYFGFDRHIVELNLVLVQKLAQVIGVPFHLDLLTVKFPLPTPSAASKQAFQRWRSSMVPKEVMPPSVVDRTQINPVSSAVNVGAVGGSPSVEPRPAVSKLTDPLGNLVGSELPRSLVIFVPGTTWSSKVWPSLHWTHLAKAILNIDGGRYSIWIIGGIKDTEIANAIKSGLSASDAKRILDLTGKTSLVDLLAVFENSDIVIGADTGPLHLAAAVGIPKVVGIYGSTPVKRNGPFGPNCLTIAQDLSCQPCFAKVCPLSTTACLKEMDAEYVFARIKDFCIS